MSENNKKQVKFINPYNFIPLGKKKSPVKNEGKTVSGVITYRLRTKTPIFIPNTSSDAAFPKDKKHEKHKCYDFYSYRDIEAEMREKNLKESEPAIPVIPGSEIRGMLRSNFEILTNGCMSSMESDMVLSKRTLHSFEPGLLRRNSDGSFDLYKAEDALFRTKGGANNKEYEDEWKDHYFTRKCYIQDDWEEGKKIFVKVERRDRGKSLVTAYSSTKNYECNRQGYVLKGVAGPETNDKTEKHCCHVFCSYLKGNEPDASRLLCKKISLTSLELALEEYVNNKKSDYSKYNKQFGLFKSGSGEEFFPVYYSSVNAVKNNTQTGTYMLSPACKTREVYVHNLDELAGSYAPCKKTTEACPTCALFGMFGDNGNLSSKLRFSDLHAEEREDLKSYYEKVLILPELSGPKLNNMEFYLKQPNKNAWFWTYDYYVDKNGNVVPYTPTLNGRKFYWHQLDKPIPTAEENDRNMTIRPLKKDVEFTGKMYFQNIDENQLKQLIWLLNAGDFSAELKDKKHGYKLGSGKPLGLGSVVIEVEKVELRTLEKNEQDSVGEVSLSYVNNPDYIAFEAANDNVFEAYEADAGMSITDLFKQMTQLDRVDGKKVHYPFVRDENDEGFKWFTWNHKGCKRERHSNQALGVKKMPTERKEIIFLQHMEAMTPELVDVDPGLTELNNSSNNNQGRGGYRGGHSNGGKGGNNYRKGKKW